MESKIVNNKDKSNLVSLMKRYQI